MLDVLDVLGVLYVDLERATYGLEKEGNEVGGGGRVTMVQHRERSKTAVGAAAAAAAAAAAELND